MHYREIFKDKNMSGDISEKISDALEEFDGDNHELKMRLLYILNKGHMCEYSAKHRIMHMIPVAYIGADGNKMDGIKNMHEYMLAMGLSPDIAMRHVKAAYEKASAKAREKGFSAPIMDANEWDAFWAMAMMMADYWYTICGNAETAAMLAYQYLSDPDRKK